MKMRITMPVLLGLLLCFTASDVFADFLGNIEFYPRFVYGSRHDEISPLKRYAQGAFLFSPSKEAFDRYDSDYSLSGSSTQDNSGLLSISTPGGTSFYGLRSLNLGHSFTAHDSTVPWNAPSYYLGGSDWLSAPSPGINFMLRYESLVLGIGVSPNWGYSNYDEGLRIDYPPQVRLLGGLEFQHFGLQPSLTLMQSEMPDGSSSLPAQDGWMLEVPFSVNIGSFGATLSAHYGVNLGHLYDGSRTTLYPGAATTTQSYLSSSGDPADVRGYGGFFDLSLGSRPVKVQVLGGIQFMETAQWRNEHPDPRWATVVRIPYAVNQYFLLSPEVGYYAFGRDANSDSETGKDKESVWLGGVQLEFRF